MDSTAPDGTEVVYVGLRLDAWLCACGFYADDEDADHGECA